MSENESGETKVSVAVAQADINQIKESLADAAHERRAQNRKIDKMQSEIHEIKTAVEVGKERDKAVEELKEAVIANERQIMSLKLSWMKLLGALAGSGVLGGLVTSLIKSLMKGGL